ncbi:MAG: hypothetical protein P9X22_03265 [Candidatus Zapsychrus exili]|nr:hypothetical protein [Candidatus Zapsychrus exili]
MSKKKPRKKMDAKQFDGASAAPAPKKEKDWSFEDIARSKPHRR